MHMFCKDRMSLGGRFPKDEECHVTVEMALT
jgi:hypothetical protein